MHDIKEDTITITKREYKKLLKDRAFLQALLTSGLESWVGYKTAVEYYENGDEHEQSN